MKILKFTPELVLKIESGEKTSTWRLFDDKDLSKGDEISLANKDTGESFGSGIISSVKITSLGTLTEEDWEGHERYVSEEEMYAAYRSYYGDSVSPESELKIISFTFTPMDAKSYQEPINALG